MRCFVLNQLSFKKALQNLSKYTPFFSLLLLGCASQPDMRTPVNALQEVMHIQQELGCVWEKKPNKLYPVAGEGYACVLDPFSSVSLFIIPAQNHLENGSPALAEVILTWKNWKKGAHIHKSERDASRAIAYIADRFFPQKNAEQLVDVFFSTQKKAFTVGDVRAMFSHRKYATYGLHKLSLKSIDRYNRWFIFTPKNTYFDQNIDNAQPK